MHRRTNPQDSNHSQAPRLTHDGGGWQIPERGHHPPPAASLTGCQVTLSAPM